MNQKEFDFYVGHRVERLINEAGPELFCAYSTCVQLDRPELQALTEALKAASDAMRRVGDEYGRLSLFQ